MQKVLFKPRSLKCDEEYQKFITWLGYNCDLKMKIYKTIDREEYGLVNMCIMNHVIQKLVL